MSKEVKDGHPCETCLRWPECNGVAWPDCQPVQAIADIDQNALAAEVSRKWAAGIMTPNEARRLLGMREI